jgi:lipoate-protein ligase A
LAEFGYLAALRGTSAHAQSEQFLCFGRHDDFDVVIAGDKVLGSAQRRRKGAVLQHGSLILERSEWTPTFPGMFECGGHAVSVPHLLERLADAVAGLFGPDRELCRLSEAERQAAAVRAAKHAAFHDRGLRESQKRPVDSV